MLNIYGKNKRNDQKTQWMSFKSKVKSVCLLTSAQCCTVHSLSIDSALFYLNGDNKFCSGKAFPYDFSFCHWHYRHFSELWQVRWMCVVRYVRASVVLYVHLRWFITIWETVVGFLALVFFSRQIHVIATALCERARERKRKRSVFVCWFSYTRGWCVYEYVW